MEYVCDSDLDCGGNDESDEMGCYSHSGIQQNLTCQSNGSLLCEHNCTDFPDHNGFFCSCHHGFNIVKLNSTGSSSSLAQGLSSKKQL